MGLFKSIGKGIAGAAKGVAKVGKSVADVTGVSGTVRGIGKLAQGDLGGAARGFAEAVPGVGLAATITRSGKQKAQSEQEQKRAQLSAQLAQTQMQAGQAQPEVQLPSVKPIQSVMESGALPVEVKEAIAARQAGLAGFSAPELAAQRSQMALQQQGAEAQAQRQLAASLARSGVRGGAAAAATGRAAQLAQAQKAQQAQDLFLRDIAQKEAARKQYEESLMGGLGLAQKQQFMELSERLTREGLASAEKTAQQQITAQERAGLQSRLAELEKQPGFFTSLGRGLFG